MAHQILFLQLILTESCQGKISPCCLQVKSHTTVPLKAFLLKVLPSTLFMHFSKVQLSRNCLRTLLAGTGHIWKFMHSITFTIEYYVSASSLESVQLTKHKFPHSRLYTGIIQLLHELCIAWRPYPWHREDTSREGEKTQNSLYYTGTLNATQESFSRRYPGLLIQSSLTSIGLDNH